MRAATLALLCLSLVIDCRIAFGGEAHHVAPIRRFVENRVKPWLHDPLIIATLKKQNALHAGLGPAQIETLDNTWRNERANGDYHLIRGVLSNPLSRLLEAKQAEFGGVVTEMLLMDASGLNVGLSSPTSDYWQGDEAKFQKSFGTGADAVFISEPEKDESTQVLQAHACMTIVDENGKAIGAIAIGIDLDYL